jgi:light-regulated signal transduction histidine kinase (bacteriophytochrome)
LEQRVAERTRELRSAVGELEAFSYTVSHDLRSPLHTIDGFARLLQDEYGEPLGEEGRHYLGRILAACARTVQLIDDLLDLSQASRSALEREPVDLSRMAREIAEELRGEAPARRVEVEIAPGLEAFGDRGLLRIVLENLLGNAWKFTSKTGNGRIEVGAAQVGGQTAYFVRDNGAGFEPTRAGRLFSPFQRLHSAAEFSGTGIGLATVQRIIRRHGGRIWAEAEVDRGATFYFTLGEREA